MSTTAAKAAIKVIDQFQGHRRAGRRLLVPPILSRALAPAGQEG